MHVHSKYSKESRARLGVKDIFDKAIEHGISVISITDHSNVDALDEIWDVYEQELIKDGEKCKYKDFIEFIPGIELKSNRGNKPIHMIVIFPKNIGMRGYTEKADTAFLKREFLGKINCSESDIKDAGKGDCEKGLFEVSVDFIKASEQARKLGGIIIIHNGTKQNGFDKGMTHATDEANEEELLNSLGTEKTLLMEEYVDICEFPNWNPANLKNIDFYLTKFKKPCIVSSDSHDEYNGQKFTWIKAEPTTEGLRQVIYEPENRIHIGQTIPNEPLYQISKVNLDFPDETKIGEDSFCLRGKNELYFSPYLTCFMGGRGTGKSSILNLIHEKLKGNNLFFGTNSLFIPEKRAIADCIKVDDDNDKKYVEFLGQNEIEQFATDHNRFTEAIFTRLLKLDSDERIKNASESLQRHLEDIELQIDRVMRQGNASVNLADIKKEYNTQKNIIQSVCDPQYTELTEVLQIRGAEYQDLKSSKKRLVTLSQKIEVILKQQEGPIVNEHNAFDKYYNEILSSLSNSISVSKDPQNFINEINIEESLQHDITKARIQLKDFLNKKGLSDENLKDVSQATEKVTELSEEIKSKEQELHLLILETREFNTNEETKVTYENEIKQKLTELNKKLCDVSSQVKRIELKYQFSLEKAKKVLAEKVLKMIEVSLNQKIRIDNLGRYLFLTEPLEVDNHEVFLDKLHQNTNKTVQALLDYFSNANNFLQYKLLICRLFFDVDQFKYIQVSYDGKPLENTSFGQRCTAAIVVLLLLGNNPIIIDEPEAHLDSSLIAEYLVELIKKQKQHRQIIFATHNANFIVNGDSELIQILSTDDNNKTLVTPSTIENLEYRDKLLTLEGGSEAFKKRENRYNC